MKFDKEIKYFQIDKRRDSLYVDVEFYQMNLAPAVEKAREELSELFTENDDFLPSWTKTTKNPTKAKGFLVTIFQAIFEGKHNMDSLNVDYQFEDVSDFRVDMAFLPGSTTNKNLSIIVKILSQALENTAVVQVNGNTMTNASAEKKVKEKIEEARNKGMNVLLVSAGMAQRSFSVGEIGTVYLAYDGGSSDATTQKVSRALTPHSEEKIGRVVSLSFDPNRDDKFDDLLVESAKNLAESKNIDINTAMKTVLRTVSLKICTNDGAQVIDKDDYLSQLIENNRLDRVIGRVANLSTLSHEQIAAIASGKVDYHTLEKKSKVDSGRTHEKSQNITDGEAKKNIDEEAKLIFQARKVITTIAENIDILLYQGGSSIDEAFAIIDGFSDEEKKGIHNLFDIDYESLKNIVNTVMNKNLLELKFGK